jgi:hypothetical protein
MTIVIANMSMSLDGFIAGPNVRVTNPLGDGGIRLFEHLGTEHIELELTRLVESPGGTHIQLRIIK